MVGFSCVDQRAVDDQVIDLAFKNSELPAQSVCGVAATTDCHIQIAALLALEIRIALGAAGVVAIQLPRVVAIWLRSQSSGESESWTLPADALAKLGKGKKYALSKRIIASVQHLTDTAFPSAQAAEAAQHAAHS